MRVISLPKVVMICCSVLEAEVESLRKVHWPDCGVRYLPSTLHMHPERLASSVESALDAELELGKEVVLIYGDCCARMTSLEIRPGVFRTRGMNCCELLLGPEEYRRLSHEGAFFLIPEWARRWKKVFVEELGLNRDNATSLMRDVHSKFLYLDTGLAPVPDEALKDCAKYCGLPYEVRRVSLDWLRQAIEESLLRCVTTGDRP